MSAGVLLCVAGAADEDLTPLTLQFFPFMSPNFDHMNAAAIIAAGDADQSILSTRGPDWWTDAYHQSPGEKSLLTLFGAEHGLGGIHAYGGVPQTPAEDPATVALVQQMTTAYLRTALGIDTSSWPAAQEALADQPEAAGKLASK